jgi:hypothetical protein
MKRNTWILLAVLAVLAVVAVVVLNQPGEQSTEGFLEEPLVQYDSASVDRLEITSAQGHIVLARQGSRWMVEDPISAPADEAAVGTAIGKGAAIRLKSLVSSNPEKRFLFQVDSTATLVRIFDHGTERAAFRIGKLGTSYRDTYVRRENSDDVYLADGVLTYVFAKPARDWRDRTIVRIDQEAIQSVEFRYGDTTFTLLREDTVWTVGGNRAAESTVRSFLASLSSMQADGFVDSAAATGPVEAEITVGSTQLKFIRAGADKFQVRSSTTPQVFEIYNWRANQLLKRERDFRAAES